MLAHSNSFSVGDRVPPHLRPRADRHCVRPAAAMIDLLSGPRPVPAPVSTAPTAAGLPRATAGGVSWRDEGSLGKGDGHVTVLKHIIIITEKKKRWRLLPSMRVGFEGLPATRRA